MREVIPAIPMGERHRLASPSALAGRAWRGTGRMLARLNGSVSAGAIHASDMEQLRRAMRD